MLKPSVRKTLAAWRPLAVGTCLVAGSLLLAGCAPTYNARPGGYYGSPPTGYQRESRQCYQGCGYVRDIREVALANNNNNGAAVGTVIGAVVGGLLGHTIGKGDGRTAATVAGAVGGGFAGHAVGARAEGNGNYGWQVVVQLPDGRDATVTQRNPPQVRVGDYVMIRGDQVYRY
ncbi:MAG TPA: glycine zipper 2TM domain-containing protein [Rhodanobacteraceae bacterium]|nr:glycine zipper 2TM domain-containing protein [Rhodanobacteraceae bacterium]